MSLHYRWIKRKYSGSVFSVGICVFPISPGQVKSGVRAGILTSGQCPVSRGRGGCVTMSHILEDDMVDMSLCITN